MSKNNKEYHKKYHKARNDKIENAERVLVNASPIGAWSYGFYDGWSSALNAKFDDRKALERWYHSSKHVFCPCSETTSCDSACPHGLSIMSGSCLWCIEKFTEESLAEYKKEVTTAIIVEGENNTFLGTSRKYDYNSWGFAGGKCDDEESPTECAIRELQEETGLLAHSLECVDVREYINKTVEPHTIDTVFCFVVNEYSGSLHDMDYLIENGEGMIQWVTPDELKSGAFGDYNTEILYKLYSL